MSERLSAHETALWAGEVASLPAHVGVVDIFVDDGVDLDRFVSLIGERLAFVPRFRQRVRPVPAGLAPPLWVDDDAFDLDFHVRRAGLPGPGGLRQLRAFVGRVMARELDRDRPLWEAYLVEGLILDGRRHFALVTKTHLAVVNGIGDVALDQVLLDDEPCADAPSEPRWDPAPGPTGGQLLLDALVGAAADPLSAISALTQQVGAVASTVVEWGESVGAVPGSLAGLASTALRGDIDSPLLGAVGRQRRWATTTITLERLHRVRDKHNVTINDLVIAIVTGALRAWLISRGDETPDDVRAVVPMSVPDADGEPTSLGSRVAPHLMVLPVAEPHPVMRLHQVSYGTSAHTEAGLFVGARQLTDIAGFAPGSLHSLGVREARRIMRRQHDLVVTNAPGPQHPRYADGARMVASYPVLPLTAGHLLAIGATSYDGIVYLGFTADRDQLPDVDDLAELIDDALDELLYSDAEAAAWADEQDT